jgi:ketosteroid isomerase-like protein
MDISSAEDPVNEQQRCLAVVQGLYACLARGDLPGYLQRIAPDVTWAWPGVPGGGSPAAGIAGRLRAIAFFTATTTCGTQRVPVPCTYLVAANTVIVQGFTGTWCWDRAVRQAWTHAWTLQDGQVVHFHQGAAEPGKDDPGLSPGAGDRSPERVPDVGFFSF